MSKETPRGLSRRSLLKASASTVAAGVAASAQAATISLSLIHI